MTLNGYCFSNRGQITVLSVSCGTILLWPGWLPVCLNSFHILDMKILDTFTSLHTSVSVCPPSIFTSQSDKRFNDILHLNMHISYHNTCTVVEIRIWSNPLKSFAFQPKNKAHKFAYFCVAKLNSFRLHNNVDLQLPTYYTSAITQNLAHSANLLFLFYKKIS